MCLPRCTYVQTSCPRRLLPSCPQPDLGESQTETTKSMMPIKNESAGTEPNDSGQSLPPPDDGALWMGSFGGERSLEIYQELILRHLIEDIGQRCRKLDIPSDPILWTVSETRLWLADVAQKLELDLIIPTHIFVTGQFLQSLAQQDFVAKFGGAGETLHAQLQIWKTAVDFEKELRKRKETREEQTELLQQTKTEPELLPCHLTLPTEPENPFNIFLPSVPPMISPNYGGSSPPESSFDEQKLEETSEEISPAMPHQNGTIHLWEFLREILDDPESCNSCVRWINRTNGTFKIENSDYLARLWGRRKNRTKMNYDKLSRSLRQYYKKNIIRKTGLKQRLIYQFVPPFPYFRS